MTFKEEWLEVFQGFKKIYILFDRDPSGFEGAKKLGQKILNKYIGKTVYQIILPEMENGKDVTDYFMLTDGNIDRLFSDECCHKIKHRN